jgi:predicted MPP superfamily phosphohydrolase
MSNSLQRHCRKPFLPLRTRRENRPARPHEHTIVAFTRPSVSLYFLALHHLPDFHLSLRTRAIDRHRTAAHCERLPVLRRSQK